MNNDLIDYVESDRSQAVVVYKHSTTIGTPYYVTIHNPFDYTCEAKVGTIYSYYLLYSNLPPQFNKRTQWQWERSTNNGKTWLPIPGATFNYYYDTMTAAEAGYKYRLVAYSNYYCMRVISNEIRVALPINTLFSSYGETLLYDSLYSDSLRRDIGLQRFNITTTSAWIPYKPECLDFQWQIAYFNGFSPPLTGGFMWGGYGFNDWIDILPDSVLKIRNKTTTDQPFKSFTNGSQTTIPGSFRATITGYKTNTLQWQFLYGDSSYYFSRKYPQLFRLKVSNGCSTVYSDPVDPDPFTTLLPNAIGMPRNFQSPGTAWDNAPLHFKVYPNPALNSTGFTIQCSTHFFTYALYDATGKLLLSGSGSGSAVVENTHLTPGIYLLLLQTEGQATTMKLDITE